MKRAVGVDFGGTAVKLGLVNEEGTIEAQTSFATGRAIRPPAWLDAVADGIRKLGLDPDDLGGRISGIGAGVPGFTDFARGHIHSLTNVPGWDGVPLAVEIERRFGVQAYVDNDVNAMALGECAFGAGRMYRHAVFVTLGTGVGGALLIDGRLYRGAHSMAGEIGHVSIDRNGIETPQGRGGVECYVGNRALVDRAQRALDGGRASLLRERSTEAPDGLTPRLMAEAAAEGDGLAREVFDEMADALATAFASITYVLQPQVFIVGGGVSLAGPVLFEPLIRHLHARLDPHFGKRIEVRPAELGNAAGMIGSATLALSTS